MPELRYFIGPNVRSALLIDGCHLSSAVQALDVEVDFKRLHALLSSRSRLIRAHYYGSDVSNEGVDHGPLMDWLGCNGYAVTRKTFDAARGIAIDLTIDALRLAGQVEAIVMIIGSADFRPLVAEVQKRGVRVTVLSTRKGMSNPIADALRRQVDEYVDLADILPSISIQHTNQADAAAPLGGRDNQEATEAR